MVCAELLPRRLADETPRFIRAAAAFVFGDLGEREQRPSADNFLMFVALFGNELVGSLSFLDPADDGFIEPNRSGPGAAEAMIDTRDKEQARERCGLLLA